MPINQSPPARLRERMIVEILQAAMQRNFLARRSGFVNVANQLARQTMRLALRCGGLPLHGYYLAKVRLQIDARTRGEIAHDNAVPVQEQVGYRKVPLAHVLVQHSVQTRRAAGLGRVPSRCTLGRFRLIGRLFAGGPLWRMVWIRWRRGRFLRLDRVRRMYLAARRLVLECLFHQRFAPQFHGDRG